MTSESRGLISKLEGSTFFKVNSTTYSETEANNILNKNSFDVILNIPSDFGKDIGKGNPTKIMASVNAINASTAQLSWAYLSSIIRDYNIDINYGKPRHSPFQSVAPDTDDKQVLV